MTVCTEFSRLEVVPLDLGIGVVKIKLVNFHIHYNYVLSLFK